MKRLGFSISVKTKDSFTIISDDNRQIKGTLSNFFISWDWNESDHFNVDERMDALDFICKEFQLV